jgi:hypothetical protein
MPVVDFKVNIEGLKELISSVAPDKLNRQITTGIRDIANDLNRELNKGVRQRYAFNKNLNSVIIGGGARITSTGNNIQATLSYEYKYNDLSQFPYSPHEILNGYAVHSATVLRGQSKIVNGKSGNGGFVPRKSPKNGSISWKARDGKTRMFERIGAKRLPLRVLYGPSLTQMANNVLLTNPTTEISDITENLDTLLAEKIQL